MHLLFCDAVSLKAWLYRKTAERVRHGLDDGVRESYRAAHQWLESLLGEGLRLGCAVESAAHLVTELYKGDPPFTGGRHGFALKKSFARTAAAIMSESVELLAPVAAHFKSAQALWLAMCVQGHKEAYAGFIDYVHAALILKPPGGYQISHVMVGHAHVPYILRKAGFAGAILRGTS